MKLGLSKYIATIIAATESAFVSDFDIFTIILWIATCPSFADNFKIIIKICIVYMYYIIICAANMYVYAAVIYSRQREVTLTAFATV